MKSKNIGHITALDHLRALAAILVIAYHAHEGIGGPVGETQCKGSLWSLLLQGHTGVGLFMVLSGFLFTHGALGQKVQYGRFIYNRVLRVFPLFLFLLIVSISTYRGDYTTLSVVQSLATFGEFPGSADYQNAVAGVSWTLSPEFQFYLVFPFLLRGLEKSPVAWPIAFFGFVIGLRWLLVTAQQDSTDMTYWTVVGRAGQFGLGMLAARAYARWHSRTITLGLLFPVALASVLALHQLGRDPPTANWWICTHDIWLGAAWGLLIVSYIPLATFVPRLLSRPMAYLGTISYSLYLLHYSAIIVFNQRHWYGQIVVDTHWNALVVFALIYLPLLTVFATLTYNVIEKPVLEMRVRYLEPRSDAKPEPELGTPPPAAREA